MHINPSPCNQFFFSVVYILFFFFKTIKAKDLILFHITVKNSTIRIF